MKRSIVSIVVIVASLTVAAGGCRSREKAVDGVTQTIEPAKPQPDTDTVALTQTVDVEKGRSEVEGRNASGDDITATGDTTPAMTNTTTTSTTVSTTTGPSVTTTTR